MTNKIQNILKSAETIISTYFLLIAILATIPFLFRSYAIYKIGKRNRFNYLWLAWIPVMRYHIVSQIADFYRISNGKDKKVTTTYEVLTFLAFFCFFGAFTRKYYLLIIVLAVLIYGIKITQIFATYYFYKFCDKENATLFFILGMTNSLLNTIFFFNCRDKGVKIKVGVYY